VKVCPTPMKTCFTTRKRALQAASRVRYKQGGERMRAYRCNCGQYHLTTQQK
jgi:hypothetical protein